MFNDLNIKFGSFYPNSAIEPELGDFLYQFILDNNLKKILEFGTGVGVSSIYMAKALSGINGLLYTYDKSNEYIKLARENLFSNGISDTTVHLGLLDFNGDLSVLRKNAPYDLIFIDAKKKLYKKLVDFSIEVLANNGFIIIDDINIAETKRVRKSVVNAIDNFKLHVENMKDIKTEYKDLGDGIYILCKTLVN